MAQTARSTRSSSSIDRPAARPGIKPAAVGKKKGAAKVAGKPAKPAAKAPGSLSGARPSGGSPAAPLRAVPVPAPVAVAKAPLAKKTAPPPPPAPTPSTDISPKRVSTVAPKGYVPLVDIPPLPPPPKNMKLEVGDKAVHPSHGLGEVIAIEHREIGSMKGEFYIIRILDNGMRVMVPKASAPAAGLRPVMSAKEADKVLDTMRAREVAVDLQPWSRRFRAYTEMIKSGSPHEVAKVLRDMYRLKFDKDLSFGERRLLDQAKSLLMKELAAAKKLTEAALQAQVDEMFKA